MPQSCWWVYHLVLLLLHSLLPYPLVAQLPQQRAVITHLRDSVGVLGDATALEAGLQRVSAGRGDPLKNLRLGVLRHRMGELTGRREHLDEAIRRFAEVARASPQWPEAWYGLALSKLELHDQGFPAKEGPYQHIGSDYLHGAGDAFIKALEADPAFTSAAERLAASVLRQAIQPQVEEALAPLRRSANGPGAADPAIQMARGLIEREAGQADSAQAAFGRFLQLGGDSAIGLLESARTHAIQGRTSETEEAYLASARGTDSPTVVEHIRSDLAWIATNAELARFDATEGAARAAWLEGFWHRRDVEEGRVPGERLVEHYRRLFYVMRHFRLVSEKQQRGTLSLVRSPLLASRSPTSEDRLRAFRRQLADEASRRGSTPSGEELLELNAKLNDQTLLRAYRSNQSVVDDRGVVYMRHGEPWKRATYAGGDSDANESWLYHTPSGSMILHFTGIAAATTLVEQLPLNPELLASRGVLDQRYERMADDAAKNRLSPQLREQDRAFGGEAIAVTTQTDTYPLRFEEEFNPVVQVVGVREGLKGAGQILVVFAAKAKELAVRRVGPESVIVYPVRVRVLAMNTATSEVIRLDTTRMFVTRRVLADDAFLTGQTSLQVSPGQYQVMVVLGDDRLDAGTISGRDTLIVPNLDAGRLTMSDLVLGRENSGQLWVSPPDTVQLNPVNAYPRGSSVEVYYQVGAMKPGHTYRTSIDVSRGDQKAARVSVNFSEQAGATKMAWLRRVGLERLPPGKYILRVTVSEADGTGTVTRRQGLNVTSN